MQLKFYICKHCGNIITKVVNKGVPVMCCGEKMTELISRTTDGAAEKHILSYKVEGNLVQVNVDLVDHLMFKEHYIMWIALKTRQEISIKALKSNEESTANFVRCDGNEVTRVYAYCNLHSLWKA
ncbi:MAG: desulfoferrodoxin [Ruminococcus sp.]|nr:desulfoferrodoxin [Ruminococcus sp.]